MSASENPASVPASGRDRLLEAAAAEFAESGYAGSSIAVIAARACVSKSTVFHHFASKEELYIAVIGNAVDDFGQRIDQALTEEPTGQSALKRFQLEHLKHLENHRQVARLILRELQDPALEGRKPLIMELLSRNFARLVRHLEQQQGGGRLRADIDCQVAALIMFAANAFYFQHADDLAQLPEQGFRGDGRAFSSAVIDILYNGLAPNAPDGDNA
ncbi:MAG: TetR/AcrR family transcriptional regulator [Pseudomonadota bacterium]|nr:MAG: TetR/AcrR family transcriptional regulator [Pseudomonadota bacterium]